MESVTHVFHLAGASSSLSDQEEMERTNVVGTRRLSWRRPRPWPVERFVHMSSTSVYGEEVQLPSPVPEDVERHPSRGYGKAKDGAERVVEEYAAGGLPTVVLRPVTVYGPGNVKLLASAILDVAIERFAGLDRVAVHAHAHRAAPGPRRRRGRPPRSTWPPPTAPSAGRSTSSCPSTRRATRWRPWWPTRSGCRSSWSTTPTAACPTTPGPRPTAGWWRPGMEPRILLSKERFRFLRKANRNNRLSVDALLGTGFEFTQTDLPTSIAATVDWYRDHRWVL